jgi:hypothetical protein
LIYVSNYCIGIFASASVRAYCYQQGLFIRSPLFPIHVFTFLERMPLRGIQGSVNLGAITALAMDDCDGLNNFLSHWRMFKPINLRTLRLLLGSHHPISSPGAAFSSFMTSFTGLVDFSIDCGEIFNSVEVLFDGTLARSLNETYTAYLHLIMKVGSTPRFARTPARLHV